MLLLAYGTISSRPQFPPPLFRFCYGRSHLLFLGVLFPLLPRSSVRNGPRASPSFPPCIAKTSSEGGKLMERKDVCVPLPRPSHYNNIAPCFPVDFEETNIAESGGRRRTEMSFLAVPPHLCIMLPEKPIKEVCFIFGISLMAKYEMRSFKTGSRRSTEKGHSIRPVSFSLNTQ